MQPLRNESHLKTNFVTDTLVDLPNTNEDDPNLTEVIHQ